MEVVKRLDEVVDRLVVVSSADVYRNYDGLVGMFRTGKPRGAGGENTLPTWLRRLHLP